MRTYQLTLCAVLYLSGQWFVLADLMERISGGDQASLEEYPYVVNIWNGNDYIGSGSIISSKCIITAAHVLSGIDHRDLRIYGAVNPPSCSKAFEARAKEVVTPVENSQRHRRLHSRLSRRHGRNLLWKNEGREGTSQPILTPKPTKLRESNNSCCVPELDIAVIVLERSHCSPITHIPLDQTALEAGENVTVVGWGYSDIFVEPKMQLSAFNSTVTPDDRCKLFWGTNSFADNHFCVEERQLGVRPNRHDAGGPAIRNGKQVGIISAVNTCTRSAVPSVYTRLSSAEVKAFLRNTLNAC